MTAAADSIGSVVLGRYRIVRELAAGGMGVVYLARLEGAAGFVRPAVIKRMLPGLSGDESMLRMFVREARILSNLQHPNIVPVLDFARDGDAYLMALEYVHGFHLGQWLKYQRARRRKVPVELAIHVITQVLDALHYAHSLTTPEGQSLGIVHRDVSPSNILLDADGNVKLVDFGVAQMAGEVTRADAGGAGLKGKFSYLAPELLETSEPSAASDTYACAVVLHELILGTNEFRRDSGVETLRRVMLHELSPLEPLRDDAPKGLDMLLARGLAKDPAKRPESAAMLAAALRALVAKPETDLRQQLRTAVRSDFFGQMPEHLGLVRLDLLERAWREGADDATREHAPASVRAGIAQAAPVSRSTPPKGAGSPAIYALLMIALVGMMLGLVIALVSMDDAPAPMVMVQQAPVELDATSEAAQVPATPAAAVRAPPVELATDVRNPGPPASPPPPVRSRPRLPRSGPPAEGSSRAEHLTRAFHSRRAQIRACIVRHGSPEEAISIRFTLGGDGRPRRVEVQPASVAASSLGTCVAEVARSTEFGPQPDAITFRIPVSVTSGG